MGLFRKESFLLFDKYLLKPPFDLENTLYERVYSYGFWKVPWESFKRAEPPLSIKYTGMPDSEIDWDTVLWPSCPPYTAHILSPEGVHGICVSTEYHHKTIRNSLENHGVTINGVQFGFSKKGKLTKLDKEFIRDAVQEYDRRWYFHKVRDLETHAERAFLTAAGIPGFYRH